MLVIVGYKPCIVIVQKISKFIPQKINYYNDIQKTKKKLNMLQTY